MADDIVDLTSSTPKSSASAAASEATSLSPEFGTRLTPLMSPTAPDYSPAALTQADGGCPRLIINGARNLGKELLAARTTEKGPSTGKGIQSESSDPEDLREFPDASPEGSGILGNHSDGRRATIYSKIANLINDDGKAVRFTIL